MIVMVAAVIYGVLMRFVFRLPNQYGEEISRYFDNVCFLGIGLVERENGNMKIDLVTDLLPKAISNCISCIARLLTVVAYIMLGVLAAKYCARIYSFKQLSTAMRVPMYIFYSFVMIGFFTGGIHSFIDCWNKYIAKVSVYGDNEVTELHYN